MKLVKWRISTGFVGAEYSGEFEVENDVSEDEIQETIENIMFDYIGYDWEVIE